VDNLGPNAKQRDWMFKNVDGKSFVDVSDQMGRISPSEDIDAVPHLGT